VGGSALGSSFPRGSGLASPDVQRDYRRFNPAFALLCSSLTMRGCPAGVMIEDTLVEGAVLDRFLEAYARDSCPDGAGRASGLSRRLHAVGMDGAQVTLALTVLLAGLIRIDGKSRETA
jgi:hypothetical protein